MSKKTHWVHVGDNITDMRSEEQKKKDAKKAFKVGLALQRMKTDKPKLDGSDKPFYAKKKKKENPDGQKSSEEIESGM